MNAEKEGAAIYTKIVTIRLRDIEVKQIDAIVTANKDIFDNPSIFIRAAIMGKIKEYYRPIHKIENYK